MTIARKFSLDNKSFFDCRWTWLVVLITIAASYLVPTLVRLGEPNPQTVWPVWPGCAILVTGLLLVGMRVWPVLILTCFAAFAASDLRAGVSFTSIAWFVPGNTLEVLIAALGLRYCFDGVPRLNNVSALAKYSAFALLLAPFTSAFLSARGIGPGYWVSWRVAFLSEALAFATITPVLLSWINEGSALARKSAAFCLEAMILITGLVIVTYMAFTYPVKHSSPALLYSLVPFFLWSALRFGWLGATTSMIIVSSLSTWAALRGRGPFSELLPFTNPLALQTFLLLAAIPFMVLAGVVEERKLSQGELRANEDKLRLLLESTAEAIYGIDLEGRCTFCNPTCVRLLGYESADQLIGMNMHNLVHQSSSDETHIASEEGSILRVFQSGEGIHSDEEVLWRADGTILPAEYWCHPLRKGEKIVGAVVAFLDITERKATEQALASMNGRLIEAQEQERTWIARELHDDISQQIALLAIQLERRNPQLPVSTTDLENHINSARQTLLNIGNQVQALSHRLHSSKLEYLGLVKAAASFCREFTEQHRVQVEFQHADIPNTVPREISLCLFRVLQESLQNAAKHSGVQHFEVTLRGTSEELTLFVSDAGSGFDAESAMRTKGLGLISMRERVQLVNGRFSIDSQAGQGTLISACVPLKGQKHRMQMAG